MNWFFRLWWLTLLIKIAIAASFHLAADEAYYWVWSHHLQWSYFDHPPMIAVMMWLGHPFENWGSAVRIPGVILGHATLIVWWQILKQKLGPDSLKIWFALGLFAPLIGLGSMALTPDLPVLFFWALSLWAFEKALEVKSASWYAALGLFLGLGFSSKYHIVLLVPIFLIYLTMEKKWRDVSFRFLPLTILCGLAGSFPVLYWNAMNDWQSFKFQLNHGLGREDYSPEWTLTYTFGQIFLFGPLLIPSFIRGARQKNLRLFSWNAIFIWGFFFYSSFKGVVEANWPGVGYSSAFAVASGGMKKKKWFVITCAFWIFCSVLVASQILFPWIPGLPDRIDEPRQFRSLAPLTEKYSPIYANTYQMASVLSFETKKPIMKLREMSRYDFFDTLPESRPTSQIFYFIRREGEGLPKWLDEVQHQTELIEKASPDFEILRITLK